MTTPNTFLKTLLICSTIAFQSYDATSLRAEPYIPQNDSVVLEQLPASRDPQVQKLRQLRAQLSITPDDLKLAANLAQTYVQLGRTKADPRYDGYAQAALEPWWKKPTPPTDVLLLRAILKQRGHQFEPALEDLTQILQRQPHHAQALLTRAVIHQVRGRFPEARQSCLPLLRLVNTLVSTSCIANISSLNGQAQGGYHSLRQSLERNPSATTEEQLWALTILAETAARLGNHAEAEQHFQQALVLDRKETYLLGAYSDFLLDQKRATDVPSLLQENIRPDGLLLRLALAAQRLQDPQLRNYIDNLSARFADSRLRGDARHLREEARFTLHLLGQPQEALQIAQENWTVQREPWDARIFLEAALTSGHTTAAQPVLDWLKAMKLEDQQISRLMEQFS